MHEELTKPADKLTHKNSESKQELLKKINRLKISAFHEYQDISDYVWKSKDIIDYQRTEERLMSERITSKDNEIKEAIEQRAEIHERRWTGTYPYMISAGNLFSIISIFESYLLLLAKECESHYQIEFKTTKGSGCEKLFNFFKRIGIKTEQIPLYNQIKDAQKIRNCLTHASGMIELSNDEPHLRKIVQEKSYLPAEVRLMRKKSKTTSQEIKIQTNGYGDQLSINNDYPHQLCFYLLDFYKSLTDEVIQNIINEQPNI